MNPEIKDLIEAIESLRQESSLIKDYIYPIIISFFSAVLGAFTAYFTLRYQEDTNRERLKLDICNKWTIEIQGLFQSLISFKNNYDSPLSSNPVHRALQVRMIIKHDEPLTLDYAELSFITPDDVDLDAKKSKWRQISRIRNLVENYNTTLNIWEARNSIDEVLKEKLLITAGNKPYADLSEKDIINTIGEKDLAKLIDLTEKAIHLTDDLIIESNDFLEKFPNIVKAVVKTNKTENYGTVLKYDTSTNQYLQNFLKKSPAVDYRKIAKIFDVTEEEAQRRYFFGYK